MASPMRARAAWMLASVTDSKRSLLVVGNCRGGWRWRLRAEIKNHQPRLRVVAWVLLNFSSSLSGFSSRARNGADNSHGENRTRARVGADEVHVAKESRAEARVGVKAGGGQTGCDTAVHSTNPCPH